MRARLVGLALSDAPGTPDRALDTDKAIFHEAELARGFNSASDVYAIIDSAIHVDGMTRDAAMRLMVEGGFQEEREAAGKWVRAQLSSTQLSTYFVGYQEHIAMRAAVEQSWGDEFSLRRYHDQALSYGSPPVRFVRALILGEEIPRRGE